MIDPSRREFLQQTGAALTVAGIPLAAGAAQNKSPEPGALPVVVSSSNGIPAAQRAMELMQAGGDPLDAVIAGVNIVEEDPEDESVGYGGLPNEEGVVELDSCVMHGPSGRGGAVAALRNIKTPSQVARLVMQRTDHVLLVGEGALRFAKAHGFEEVNLLTEKSRKAWLHWKETHSDRDKWIPPDPPPDDQRSEARPAAPLTYGTITCLGVDARGDIGGVTTTSGLSFKIPGRVGDSPIIGAGLFVDNQVGAAGATGRGEACILVAGSHTVVEAMRQGRTPTEACLEALRRVARTTTTRRLLDNQGRPSFNLTFYAVSKSGAYGAAAFHPGTRYTVFANGRNRLETGAALYE